jgi:hypothetical protein
MNDMTRPNNLPVVATAAALPMSAEQVRDHVNAIQTVMQAVMKKDVHFGTIPGTPKPTLYKPGAEMLCMAFHIDPSFQIEDLSTADYYRYRVRCIGRHQQTQIKLGEGMGSASSSEEKYKWRKAICDEEFELAPESRKRVKFGKSKDSTGFYKAKQLRAEPDDIDNTVLKMACKRAHIAMTLNVLAASDIFTQDIEDLPEHLRSEEPTADPDVVAKWVAAATGAADSESLKKIWDEGKEVLKAIGDSAAYQALKKVVEERATKLKASKPEYPADKFAKNLPGWLAKIKEGEKTPADVIAMVESKNSLTAEQRAAIEGKADPADGKAIAAMVEKAAEGEISIADICKYLKVEKLEGITVAQLERARAFVADPAGAA